MIGYDTVATPEQLADLVKRAACDKDRIILSLDGKEVAALVPIEDVEYLEEIEDREDIAAADAALAEPGEPIPWEVVKEELHRQ